MELIRFDADHSGVTVTDAMLERAARANELLHTGKGAGNDFLGWVSLPSSIGQKELSDIESVAAKLRGKADTVICIGIGGSYLGAKAVLEAMTDSFESLKRHHDNPTILFAGQNISEDYTHELLAATAERSIAVIVISKSGTTTEPAIAFRLLKAELERRYGKEEAAERIVAITDSSRGALKTLATNEGYPTFVIPEDRDPGRLRAPVPLLRRVVEAALRRERGQGGQGYIPRQRDPHGRSALYGTVHSGGRAHSVRDDRLGGGVETYRSRRGRRG